MEMVPALPDGELSVRDKKLMIANYGIHLPGLAYRTSCSGGHQFPFGQSPKNEHSPDWTSIKSDPAIELRSNEVQLGTLHLESRNTEVPILASGGFYTEYTNSVEEMHEWNKNVIFCLDVADMENCPDHACVQKAEETFIETAICALEHGVKAVLISYEMPKWSPDKQQFTAFNFAIALKKLVERHAPLQYRDQESIRAGTTSASQPNSNESEKSINTGAEQSTATHPINTENAFSSTTPRQIWVKLDLTANARGADAEIFSNDELHEQAWNWWSTLLTYVEFNPKFGLCLQLDANLPVNPLTLRRWFAERLRGLILPQNTWRSNKQNYPVLPGSLKKFLIESHHFPDVTYLVSALSESLSQVEMHKQKFLYLLHLYKEYYRSVLDPDRQKCMRHMADLPIRPLQPLRDQLTTEIYAVFEADPVKYKLYYQATVAALEDLRVKQQQQRVVIIVVGAGRGPLVTEALRAVVQVGLVEFKIYALDKNPIAISAMRAKLESEWREYADQIEIVESDMRHFQPDEEADVMISELIGSFGCNELSPECLDGAQRLLKRDGVSIPASYTNYLQPVMAEPVYEDVYTFAPKYRKIVNEMVLVELRSCVALADYQPCMTFHHPHFAPHSNERKVVVKYRARVAGRLHGFAGYFDLQLYKSMGMNILPDRQTLGLGSWYPAFFALHSPVDVKEGDEIVFRVVRKVDFVEKRVWYSWALLKPRLLPLQNVGPDHFVSM